MSCSSCTVVERAARNASSDGPIVVTQALGEQRLVVAVNDGLVLHQQLSKPQRRRGLAVREMMHDLRGAPLARDGMRRELARGQSGERLLHRAHARAVPDDEILPFSVVHGPLLGMLIRVAPG